MAKIGFEISKDNYTSGNARTKYFTWADDGLKHGYDLIGFRFVDGNDNILFIGNIYDDINKKSHEMALHWCCNKLSNDEEYSETEFHFEISINGSWIRKF